MSISEIDRNWEVDNHLKIIQEIKEFLEKNTSTVLANNLKQKLSTFITFPSDGEPDKYEKIKDGKQTICKVKLRFKNFLDTG